MVVVETISSTNVENSLEVVVVEIYGLICISIEALMVMVVVET